MARQGTSGKTWHRHATAYVTLCSLHCKKLQFFLLVCKNYTASNKAASHTGRGAKDFSFCVKEQMSQCSNHLPNLQKGIHQLSNFPCSFFASGKRVQHAGDLIKFLLPLLYPKEETWVKDNSK